MKATVVRPPSRLSRLEPKLRKVLPGGLPPALARFYAEGDGLRVSFPGLGPASDEIVGLEAMFGAGRGGAFMAHEPVRRGDDLGERLALGGPFEGLFYTSDEDETEGPRARRRIDLKLRLRLVCSVAGESSAFGVDLYGEQGPQLYFVHEASEVLPLWLDFETFVENFVRFGTHRWYFAFLDRRSERRLNIDLAAEIERSLAPFGEAATQELLAQARASKARLMPAPATKAKAPTAGGPGPKKAAKEPAKKPSAKKPAAKEPSAQEPARRPPGKAAKGPAEPVAGRAAVDPGAWLLAPPALPDTIPQPPPRLRTVETERDALLAYATRSMDAADVAARSAAAARAFLRSKKWASLHWPAVLLGAPLLDEDDVVGLASLYLPVDALVALARVRGWKAARLRKLARETEFAWKKKPLEPHVSQTFEQAADALG